jgi:hypothetical protein
MVDETATKAPNLNKLIFDHFVEFGSNGAFEIVLLSECD